MKDRDIIERIEKAYSVKSPDVLRSLDFDGVEMTEAVPPKVKHRYVAAAAVYAAACLVLVIALPFFIGGRFDDPVKPDPGTALPESSYASEMNVTLTEDPPVTDFIVDDSVEVDFTGDEFKFLHYGEFAEDGGDLYIWYDSSTGTAISDAVVERNRVVAEKHGITIAAEAVADPAEEAQSRMLAGQCDFEAVLEKGVRTVPGILDGLYYDYRELESEGMDLSQSYWMPGIADDLTIDGQMYLGGGYITMDTIDNAQVLFFNKGLMTELGLNEPYGSPYDYVYSDVWLYGAYFSMLIEAEEDLDKDGKMTTADRYGGISKYDLYEGMLDRYTLVEYNEDDTYSPITSNGSMFKADDTYRTRIQVISDIWGDSGLSEAEILAGRVATFGDNRALFIKGGLSLMRTDLNEFCNNGLDFGIAPIPRPFSSGEYVTRVDSSANMLAIPAQVKNSRMTAVILEELAYQSEQLLYPAYIEDTMKNKRVEDARDYDMLEVILDSITYDWTDIYMADSTLAKLPMSQFVSDAISWAYVKEECQAELDTFIEQLRSLKDDYVPPVTPVVDPALIAELEEMARQAEENYRASDEWDGDDSYIDPEYVESLEYTNFHESSKKYKNYKYGVEAEFSKLLDERFPDAVTLTITTPPYYNASYSIPVMILEPDSPGYTDEEDTWNYLQEMIFSNPKKIHRDLGTAVVFSGNVYLWNTLGDYEWQGGESIEMIKNMKTLAGLYGYLYKRETYQFFVDNEGKEAADMLMPEFATGD